MKSATNTFGYVDWQVEYIMLKIVKSGGENKLIREGLNFRLGLRYIL